MSKKRVAIISATGTTRKRTIPALAGEEFCQIVAVHGRDEKKLKTLCKEYGIQEYFTDESVMLDAVDPDFVYIGSPPTLHLSQIRACAERKLPVLCEKPLCLDSTEALEVASLANSKGVPIRIAHHLRHQDGILKLKSIIDESRLGKPRRISLQWSFWLNQSAPNATWKLDPATGGPNAFYDAGIHAIDLLLHLLPEPSKVVAVSGSSRFESVSDNVSALLICDGTIAELNASHSMKCPSNQLLLDCENGSVRIPYALGEKSISEMHVITESGLQSHSFSPVNLYAEEVRDFVGLLNGKPSRGTTLSEAILATRILEGISEASTTGKTIELGK